MGISPLPGKFPATIKKVLDNGDVVLSASPEDSGYLKPFVGQAVNVDITPAHSHRGDAGSTTPQ
jgi:hypothetical protein